MVATHVSEIHCQDLLFYGIIDLVKNGDCATKTALKDELAELTVFMDNFLNVDHTKDKTIKKYSKKLLNNIIDLKKFLKEEKSKIRLLVDNESSSELVGRKDTKTIIKMIKLFVKSTNNRNVLNWLKKEMTEAEFTARFVAPLMDLTLKSCSAKMVFQFGEQKLLFVKDYENSALTEDDTRLPGPNIDGIIKNMNLDIPIALLEASGSPNSHNENFSHYKGDRNKLAKNLEHFSR